MVYRPNIPQATDFIAQSQADLKSNFVAVNDIWGKPPTENENIGDHVPLTNPQEAYRGKHKKLTLVNQDPEPTADAGDADLYSADTSGSTEIYYRRNADAAGNQITSSGGLVVGGLVLRAYVLFDIKGNIIELDRTDAEGEIEKVPVSFNIDSVAVATAGTADFLITFSNTLGTTDYFWVLQAFSTSFTQRPLNFQPKNNALYSDTVTATTFRCQGITVGGSGGVTDRGLNYLQFQAYTVA